MWFSVKICDMIWLDTVEFPFLHVAYEAIQDEGCMRSISFPFLKWTLVDESVETKELLAIHFFALFPTMTDSF